MEREQLKAAGFSEAEIAEHEKLQSAGFSPKEVDDYYAKGGRTQIPRSGVSEFLAPTGRMLANIPKDIGQVVGGAAKTAQTLMSPQALEIPKAIASLGAGAGWEAVRQVAPGMVPKHLAPSVEAGRKQIEESVTKPIKEKGVLPFLAEAVIEHPVETVLNILPFSKMAKAAKTASEVSDIQNIRHAVKQGYAQSVFRGMEKGKGIKAVDKYFDRATESTVDVVANKPNLSFVNETGEIITGRLPKSLGEMAQAVAGREQSIYEAFNQMAKEAKEGGIRIDMRRIANKLDEISKDKVVRTETPEASKYAADRAKAYRGGYPEGGTQFPKTLYGPTGKPIETYFEPPFIEYDPLEMEKAIKIYNQKLAAYQKSPHPELAKQADIDGMILRMMREDADAAISKATGPRYSDLKKAYGAHRAVEDDIVRKFNQEMRKVGGKDWVNITDIYSVGEALTGILTLHPIMIAKGGMFAFAKKLMQHYWSPDAIMSKMFEKVDRLMQGGKVGLTGKAGRTLAKTAGPAATVSRVLPTDEEMEEKIRAWLEAGPK